MKNESKMRARYNSYLRSFASRLGKGYEPRNLREDKGYNGKKPLTFEQYKKLRPDAERDSFNTRFDMDSKKPATVNSLLIEKSFGGKKDWSRASHQLEGQKKSLKGAYYKVKNKETGKTYLQDLGLEGAELDYVEDLLEQINSIGNITPKNYGYFSDLLAELALYIDDLDKIFSPKEQVLRKYGLDFM